MTIKRVQIETIGDIGVILQVMNRSLTRIDAILGLLAGRVGRLEDRIEGAKSDLQLLCKDMADLKRWVGIDLPE